MNYRAKNLKEKSNWESYSNLPIFEEPPYAKRSSHFFCSVIGEQEKTNPSTKFSNQEIDSPQNQPIPLTSIES